MPEDEVTGATENAEGVTETEEPSTTGSEDQNSIDKLSQFETRLQELEAERARDAEARAEAERRAQEAEDKRKAAEELAASKEREYKGLQRETNNKVEELKVLRQQLANQTITQTKLERMERLVDRMAEQQLSPEEVAKLNQEIEAERNRKELEAYRAAQQQQQQRPPALTPEYKQQLKEAYFRDFDVDPSELTLEEWAQDAKSPKEWYDRTRAAFQRRHDAKKPVAPAAQVLTPEEIRAQIRQQMKEEFEASQAKNAEALAETQQTIKQLQEELVEAKRLADEASKRSKGMDRVGGPAVATRQAAKALAELPPDSWIYGTPEQREAYSKAMNDKSLRDRIIAGAR